MYLSVSPRQHTAYRKNSNAVSSGTLVLSIMLAFVLFTGTLSASIPYPTRDPQDHATAVTISQAGLSNSPFWSAESNQNMSLYGESVTSGDFNHDGFIDLAVGAPEYSPSSSLNKAGRVFVYYGTDREPSSLANWTANGVAAGAYFGYALCAADLNGDGFYDLIVGAPDSTNPLGNDYGHVYAYYGSPAGLSQTADWSVAGGQVISQLGHSVDGGNANSDRYQDVLVGAPGDLNPATMHYTGMAYFYPGSLNGLSSTPLWKAGIPESNQIAGANYGSSVSFLGDVNYDGYGDIGIGAPNYDVTSIVNSSHEGKVYVYYGTQTGPSTTPSWTGQGNTVEEEYGYSLASAGNVNGDNYSDMIIGAPCEASLCTGTPALYGQALVYTGSSTGLASTPAWTTNSGQAYSAYGYSVSSAGDVSGDRLNDVLVGAPYYSTGFKNAGRVYAYYGSSKGLSTTPGWTNDCNQSYCDLGSSLASAGDINRDGGNDIMIGAMRHRSQLNDSLIEGWAEVYGGSPIAPTTQGIQAAGGPRPKSD